MKKTLPYFLILAIFVPSCATFKPQYNAETPSEKYPTDKKVAHTLFLIGDAGDGLASDTLQQPNSLSSTLKTASKNSTLLFLGDNIYPAGMPNSGDSNRKDAEIKLQNQINLAQHFPGKTLFIPGNHDWYSKGVEGLKREQDFVEKQLGKKSFLPRNGCAIATVTLSDAVVLILVDSQWYITNWDNEPTINEACDIKTRTAFLEEFRSEIKKARGKTTLVALHHPMFSNGAHGGQYAFKSYLHPLPILGSFKNVLRETSGISNADMQNAKYNELKKNLVAAAQQNDKVIFLSGHDHNLQYLVEDNLHQIISGSGSKISETRLTKGGRFSYGAHGYALLDIFEDGSSFVRFITSKDSKVAYQSTVLSPDTQKHTFSLATSFPAEIKSTIYSEQATTTSKFYDFLWGKKYRATYSIPITAKTVALDTLYGGLTPVRKGGGNQSKTLRLRSKDGKQFVMRAMKKNASQYIQSTVFKDQYVEGKFKNTATETLVMDAFTGSYPYAPLVIPSLSDAIGVYHLTPKLYYIPKQKALGDYNTEFGGALYFFEEQASEDNLELDAPNFTGNVISTTALLLELHSDESKTVDEAAYIRARLFDMLLNDWDRHQDQWRWLEFKENGQTIYRPLPRDRDQAFSKMSDGFILGAAVQLIPPAKLLRKYSDDLKDVKGFNVEPYPLDMAFITSATKATWDAQVRVIQNNLTPAVIEQAFQTIPKEANNESVLFIKKTLAARKNNLQKIADRYYHFLHKYAVLTASDKDDLITIACGDSVTVSLFRKKKNNVTELFFRKTYDPALTKELWIYGLDDSDTFEVTGKSNRMKIRLIGGQNQDDYHIQEGKNIYVYDYKTKKNNVAAVANATLKLTDDYDTNTYDYKKLKKNIRQIIPIIGANPDDGLKIGVNNIFTMHGFERNPFTQKHQLKAAYYFATDGYELHYQGEFAHIIGNLNLLVLSNYQSANFSQNFFGYGTSTVNDDALFGMDYNRVKVRDFGIAPSLVWKANGGSMLHFGVFYKAVAVEKTPGRFVASTAELPPTIFKNTPFAGVRSKFEFENYDNKAYPTNGMRVAVELGFTSSLQDRKRNFVYLTPELGFTHRLLSSGTLVLATLVKSHLVFNNHFEFYQAASIGGNDGLRGFRNQRFIGQQSLYQNTDLRYTFNSLKTGIIPLRIGIYGGFDYGRVWIDSDPSNQWKTSYGGGFFLNGAELVTANLGLFHSVDGMRLAFSLGFQF